MARGAERATRRLALGLVVLASGTAAAQVGVVGELSGAKPGLRPALPARVVVDAGRVTRTLPADLLGSNLQYPEGGDGVLDEATGTLRPAAVAAVRELGPATLRFPGGTLSEYYHWRDGVGPVADRPPGVGPYVTQVTSNGYGTDEHLAMCRAVGAEPTITANFGTGTPLEAANWVEYCNRVAPTSGTEDWTTTSWGGDEAAPSGYFAWLRARFGHPEPYGVARWEVGNEVYNQWSQHFTAAEYAERFLAYCQAMKAVDPTVKVAAVGYDRADLAWRDGDQPWNRTVARIAGSCLDALHVHTYAPARDDESVVLVSNGEVGGAVTVPLTGTYEVRFTAQGLNLLGAYPPSDGEYAELDVLVDGHLAGRVSLTSWVPSVWTVPVRLGAGSHVVSVAFVNDLYDPAHGDGRDVVVARELEVSGAGASWRVALAPPSNAAEEAVAGAAGHGVEAARIAEILRQQTGRDDREVWVTEYNLFFGVAGFGIDRLQSFLAAPTLARYTIEHVRAGVDLLQQWSLVGDWYFGMLHDTISLGRRATGEVFPLLARGLRGALLRSTVAGPTFTVPAGANSALAGERVQWLDAAATHDGDSLRVLLVNGHPSAEVNALTTVLGAATGSQAAVTTISSAGCDTVDGNPDEASYSFAPGVAGEALHLDASHLFFHPTAGRVSAAEGTVELWLEPDWNDDDGEAHTVLSLGLLLRIEVTEDGVLLARVASELGDALDWAAADVRGWRAGSWHHLAVTWDQASLRLYVDGAESWRRSRAAKWTWVDPGRGLVLGAAVWEAGPSLDGWVDEVRVERRVLSGAEIADDVARGRAGTALAADPDTGILLHLDGSLADALRDERTHVTVTATPVVGGAFSVEVPPCGVALAEIDAPRTASR